MLFLWTYCNFSEACFVNDPCLLNMWCRPKIWRESWIRTCFIHWLQLAIHDYQLTEHSKWNYVPILIYTITHVTVIYQERYIINIIAKLHPKLILGGRIIPPRTGNVLGVSKNNSFNLRATARSPWNLASLLIFRMGEGVWSLAMLCSTLNMIFSFTDHMELHNVINIYSTSHFFTNKGRIGCPDINNFPW